VFILNPDPFRTKVRLIEVAGSGTSGTTSYRSGRDLISNEDVDGSLINLNPYDSRLIELR